MTHIPAQDANNATVIRLLEEIASLQATIDSLIPREDPEVRAERYRTTASDRFQYSDGADAVGFHLERMSAPDYDPYYDERY